MRDNHTLRCAGMAACAVALELGTMLACVSAHEHVAKHC
jgi:hypothetical protein